jgi:tellurite resistance protein
MAGQAKAAEADTMARAARGLAEAPARWIEATRSEEASAPDQPAPWLGPSRDFFEYWIDSWQRTILFWDVLRKRGNQAIAHQKAGTPPVLVFEHEMVMDGRLLDRPVNYALVRILPEPGMVIDARMRPFVIVDPRAGHGPGIGGFKEDSEVGVAMRAGHPVYFVTFFPEPEPGQTIEDIIRAEAKFLKKVADLHPDAEGRPVVVGNCQAGWAAMMLCAAAPELPGIVAISGAPLSYWAGVEGKNPMRYSGGLLGGSWLAALAGDLGHGKFDGAYLVQNFENLDPANTLWSKQYGLYAKVDTEEPRFLAFEKWWSGYFFMTAEEIRFIVDELFVGNKLTRGEILTSDRRRINLKNIRAPIVVFASWGDNITPPQQALGWITDIYDGLDEIVANEQVIVYTLDQRIGHLGIFVSAKIAEKQHAEIVNTLDIIDTLPPGLYEMVLDEKRPEDLGVDLLPGRYLVRFEGRRFEDLKALDDGREDERPFEAVARISEINEGLYDTFLRPWVRLFSNQAMAETLRTLQPVRLQRQLISDMNPMLRPVEVMAHHVRANRQPAGQDNPFVRAEHAVSDQIEAWLDLYRDVRDRGYEVLFKAIYRSPLVEALVGQRGPYANTMKPHARDEHLEKLLKDKVDALRGRGEQGGFAEAVIRIAIACAAAENMVDARAFRLGERLWDEHPVLGRLSHREIKQIVKEEAFMLRFDREGALAALPRMLRDEALRREALEHVRRTAGARGEITPERKAVLSEIERILGLTPQAAATGAAAAGGSGGSAAD